MIQMIKNYILIIAKLSEESGFHIILQKGEFNQVFNFILEDTYMIPKHIPLHI